MHTLLEHIISLDEHLFLFLNNLGNETWDNFWLFITDKESWIPFYIALLIYVIYRIKKWQFILSFLLSVVLLITVVDQSITVLFKPGFGRFRPCHYQELDGLFRLVKSHCGGKYSFFSAHAANSFALAYFVSFAFSNRLLFVFLLFSWATLVAYSRIYVGVHYPIDILVGTVWGLLLGWLATKLYFSMKCWIKK